MSTLNGQNNEHEQDLLQATEQIVQGEAHTPHDPRSPLGVAARLASTVPQPDAAFADRLEARLVTAAKQRKEVKIMDATNKPGITTIPTRKRNDRWTTSIFRMATSVVVTGVLMIGLVGAVPPARAWAQDTISDLLTYFGFERGDSGLSLPIPSASAGPAILVDPNTMPAQQPDNCVTFDNGTFCGEIPDFRTREAAEAHVDFSLKMPTYLPPNHLAYNMFEVVSPNIVTWSSEKQHVEGRLEAICDPSIMLRQIHPVSSDSEPAYIGDAAATSINVAGHEALLIENLQEGIGPCTYGNAITGEQGTVTPITNVLVWEQNDIRYYLSADARLGRDELIKIAESLR